MTELRHEAIVPAGAAFFALPKAPGTESYAFILVPDITLLAFVSAVEPLRIANQITQQPLYRWSIWSATGAAVQGSSGILVGIEAAIPVVERTTKIFVCAGNPAHEATAPEVVAALDRHHRHGGTVGGICTKADSHNKRQAIGRFRVGHQLWLQSKKARTISDKVKTFIHIGFRQLALCRFHAALNTRDVRYDIIPVCFVLSQ